MTTIAGRIAVVTGGASGIGRGIAEALIEDGATVVIADVEAGALAATAEQIGATGIVTDVTSRESVEALAAAVLERFGRVDIVVNNAGVGPVGRVKDLTDNDWRWILGVNLWGVIHGISVFLPLLEANDDGGHIVNTASMASFSPLPGLGAYAVTKFGVDALTETLRIELAEDGSKVKATLLTPGTVHTNIKDSSRNRPKDLEGGLKDIDLTANPARAAQRWIQPITAGRITTRAILNDDAFAVTHPDWWPRVAERQERIRAAFERYPVLEE